MADWKKIWNDTPAEISGAIVLAVVIGLITLVNYTWFASHGGSSMKYAIAAAIGGTLLYKWLRYRKITLDPERTVTGKLAVALGVAGGVLFAQSALFAVLKFGV